MKLDFRDLDVNCETLRDCFAIFNFLRVLLYETDFVGTKVKLMRLEGPK